MIDRVGYLLFALPTPILIIIAVLVATVALLSFAATIASRAATKKKEELTRRQKEQDRRDREQAAAVKRQDQETARRKKQQAEQRVVALAAAKRRLEEQNRQKDKELVDALGKHGAGMVKRAKSSVDRLVSTEAARDGWLGDVDFTPDLDEIEANLVKAQALRGKSAELSSLSKPNGDDRKIIAEAKATITQLERRTKERVELLEKCASGAGLIDDSLRQERDEAQLALKREELHGELAAMLYGIEAADASQAESAADVVIARVAAYREIKGEIERARDATETPAAKENDTGADSSDPWIAPLRQAWKWVSE